MRLLLKKLIYISFIAFCFALFTFKVISQPSITWQRLYNGPNSRDEEAYAICEADSGNFYIAGSTNLSGVKPYIIKLNSYGDTIWTKVVLINGGGGIVNALQATADGGCVATGEKFNLKFLYRLDKNGNIVWIYTFNGNVIYYDLKRAINGDYICAGFYQNGGASLRIDTLGNVKYDKLYPNYFFQFHSIQVTSDNGCLIAGYTLPNQAIVVKLDSMGNILDSKSFRVNNQETIAFGFEKDSSSNYVLSGNYWNGTRDIPYFIKLDINLNPLDTHIFPQLRKEIAHSMKILPNNEYIWSFYFYTASSNDSSFNRLLITNNTGNILYEKVKYTHEYEEFTDIQPIKNGDIIFCGHAQYNFNPAFQDIFVMRTDSLFNFPPNIIGIHQISTNVPENYKLYQNYPNPFNPETKIKFELPERGLTQLTIYDVLGREVKTLINAELKAGIYEVKFDGSNFSSGMYFYLLEANEFKDTKKMVLIK